MCDGAMPKYKNAILLYNGNAGKDNLDKKLKQVLPILSMTIKELRVVQTETVDELKEYCKRYAENVELLIILGGDGTIHEVVNAIAALEKRPIIGILPGGTSNDFSRTLGLPQNLNAAAETIVVGNSMVVDLAKADDNYFLNFWGIGLIADTSENIDADEKSNLGILSYFISSIRTLNQSANFTYKIQAEDRKEEGEAVLIGVFNGRFIGTRRIALPLIKPDDGKLDVIIVRNSSLAAFRELLSIVNPNTDVTEFEEVIHFQSDKIRVETGNPMRIDMDGEIYQRTPSNIEILPGHIRMIYGQDFLAE